MAVDKKGGSYLAGRTNSPSYPTRRPVQKRIRGTIDGCVTSIKK